VHEGLRDQLDEYCESLARVRKLIRRAKENGWEADLKILYGMEKDLEWTIEYMVTGYPPPQSTGPYRRAIPVDPQKVLVWFAYPPPLPLLPVEQVRLKILAALDILSPQEKEAYLMVVGEGLSYKETAEIMGVKRATVQSYVERAKVKISKRRAIQQKHEGEREFAAAFTAREGVFRDGNQEDTSRANQSSSL